jgi:hypothetical protein
MLSGSGRDILSSPIGERGETLKQLISRLLLWTILATAVTCLAADRVNIQLKNGSKDEQQTKAQLEQILKSYDLGKYTFTHDVVIDENSIPHSDPILTLHTRHLKSDDQLLSTYVHEQLHRHLEAQENQTHAAEMELRKLYPKVPVGFPEGANDEQATYEHLIVCYLEMQADRELVGRERATALMNFWAGDHYRWVYKTVIQDELRIAEIVQRNHLEVR